MSGEVLQDGGLREVVLASPQTEHISETPASSLPPAEISARLAAHELAGGDPMLKGGVAIAGLFAKSSQDSV